MAAQDAVTGVLSRLRKVRDGMLALSKATRESEPSCSKTYEECAEMVTNFIVTELDNERIDPPQEEAKNG